MKELFKLKNKIRYPKTDKKNIRYRYFTRKLYQLVAKNKLV